MKSKGKIILLLLIAAAIASFLFSGGTDRLSVAGLKQDYDALLEVVATWPVASAIAFALAYVAVTALSLPGAAAMTLAAGALFGLVQGTIIASIASVAGATLAMLSSRFVARDWVRARFPKAVQAVDRGLERDGNFYLLSLRLIPIFPFFLVNLTMGLTAMRVGTFAALSAIGMLPGTIVFVNAGTQLAAIDSTSDILSPALIGSFVLLGTFPLIAKFVVGGLRRRRVYKGYKRPGKFDRNLIVIGAGAGGLVTAYIAATVRAKVTLIEANKMGGDCLNTGCVPSKALIRSARLAHEIRTAGDYGLRPSEPEFSFRALVERIHDLIKVIEPADSVERYTGLGVDVRLGYARLVDPWTVEIDGRERLTARSIVIAAGGEPAVPDIPGLEGHLTSDTMWDALRGRDEMPRRIAIVGGGPIGCELAQAFARLGAEVALVQREDRILPKEDEEVAAFVADTLRAEGVTLLTGHETVRCEGKTLIVKALPLDGGGLGGGDVNEERRASGDSTPPQPMGRLAACPASSLSDGPSIKGRGSASEGEASIPYDEIIVAVGRKARLTGYGLEELGIETDRTIVTNDYLETLYPNIFAAGDVAGPYQFTHFAAHQAWYAAVNALFGGLRKFRTDYSVLPWVTYTDPEVAHVGHNELSAKEAGVAYEVVRYDLGHLDRAVTESAARGFVKLLVAPGKDRILGVTIVASQAGEMIAEYVLAMKHGLGLNKVLGTIHAYPTMAEANKYAAGEWKKAHKPERLLAWVERYHRWRRG